MANADESMLGVYPETHMEYPSPETRSLVDSLHGTGERKMSIEEEEEEEREKINCYYY